MRISDERLAELAGIPTLDGALWESDGIVIATAAQLVLDLRDARASLRLAVAALEKVTNKHQSYDENGSGQYGIGVTDGHRCAAGYASAALAKIESLMATEEPAK